MSEPTGGSIIEWKRRKKENAALKRKSHEAAGNGDGDQFKKPKAMTNNNNNLDAKNKSPENDFGREELPIFTARSRYVFTNKSQ